MPNFDEKGYTIRYMNLLRFILPFLFVRNWHDGSWELSHTRAVLFGAVLLMVLVGFFIALALQAPVTYSNIP